MPYGDNIFDFFKDDPEAEKQTLQNMYAQGYLGQDVSGGVVEERSPLGQAFFGSRAPRAAKPQESYYYKKGQEDSQDREFQSFERDTKRRTQGYKEKANSLSDMINIANETGRIPEELLAEYPDARDDLEDFIKIRKRRLAEEESAKDADKRYKRALTHKMLNPTERTPKDPIDVLMGRVGKLQQLPGFRNNIDLYTQAMQAAETYKNDPKKASGYLKQAEKYKAQMAATAGLFGVSPQEMDTVLGSIDTMSPYNREPAPEMKVNTPEEIDRAMKETYPGSDWDNAFPLGSK